MISGHSGQVCEHTETFLVGLLELESLGERNEHAIHLSARESRHVQACVHCTQMKMDYEYLSTLERSGDLQLIHSSRDVYYIAVLSHEAAEFSINHGDP